MRIRLGYACSSNTLLETYCHTITYTRWKKLTKEEQYQIWEKLVTENLKNLKKILEYNVENEIYFFRLSPHIIPLATHQDMTFDYITPWKQEWREIGNYIKLNHMRVDFHPDQFCILNSNKEEIFKNSKRTLLYLEKIAKAMDIPCKMILHVGSMEGGKEEAIARFKNHFQKLPISIQKSILLENDDRSYHVEDVLNLARELNIPMVLDILHDKCNPSPKKLNAYLTEIIHTWKEEKTPPKIHLSSSKNKTYKWHHHDYIALKDFQNTLSLFFSLHQDIDIMIEAKAKDEALLRLRRQIKHYLQIDDISFS